MRMRMRSLRRCAGGDPCTHNIDADIRRNFGHVALWRDLVNIRRTAHPRSPHEEPEVPSPSREGKGVDRRRVWEVVHVEGLEEAIR